MSCEYLFVTCPGCSLLKERTLTILLSVLMIYYPLMSRTMYRLIFMYMLFFYFAETRAAIC